jgi:signal transduction histidine kinase
MNRALEMITGVRKEEIIDKTIGPEWAGNPRYKVLTQMMFPSLAASVIKKTIAEWPQIAEVTIKDPQELHLEISTNQIFDENGKLIGFIKVIRDRSRELALARSKNEFIAVAAHQMRTPLTGIRWALDALKSGALSEDQKSILSQTSSSVEKLLKLIDALFNVAKIEEGKFGYVMEKSDLYELVKAVLESLAQAAESRGVRLALYPAAEPLPKILMDKSKLSLAFQNIIENGIIYNVKNGEVRVKIEKLSGRPYVQIIIQDTGIGIPDKEIKRLFTKFFRGETAIKTDTEGSGLGLYIARNIVMRHGGEIAARSVEKRGTTFTILLPTEESLVPPTEAPAAEIF